VSDPRRIAVGADVGSTYTKAFLVDLDTGALLGAAEHPTTVGSDVLRGFDAASRTAADALTVPYEIVRTDLCSSAGGGLRLAVVGYERLVTAEAGQKVGLSAGARVVHVAAGPLDGAGVQALRADRPDVVLLVGGTDGGDADVLRHNAHRLAAARLRVPVVVAGNVDARDDAMAALAGRGVTATATANVLPRIGVLEPGPARAAIRDVFLSHVIGGKGLSRGPRFASLVRGPTPDVVLTAVELLAAEIGGDLLVVDVGGATTDVYSVLDPDAEGAARPPVQVAGALWHSRTVEGDLGVREGAAGVVAAARAERLLGPGEADDLTGHADRRADDPSYLPTTDSDQRAEARLATLAALVAVRRHARGRDLRHVRALVGSGGVLRHARDPEAILAPVLTDTAGGWALPTSATVAIDRQYRLAPAGLLATVARADTGVAQREEVARRVLAPLVPAAS
jgi:uncharacterized protein (TIGR01319 family)